jgi:hypothetical protein
VGANEGLARNCTQRFCTRTALGLFFSLPESLIACQVIQNVDYYTFLQTAGRSHHKRLSLLIPMGDTTNFRVADIRKLTVLSRRRSTRDATAAPHPLIKRSV